MALVRPKHLAPLGPVALDGVVRDLAALRLGESEGDHDDPLGVRRLVREGILTARNGKEQADLLDTFKEKIKTMTTTQPPTPAPMQAVEEAYTLMLQLYLHPQTALLKKAAHRILLQLVALATALGYPTLETTQAQAFKQQWTQEKGLLLAERTHTRAETSTNLQLIDEMAFFGPTRAALCRGRGGSDRDYPIQPLMRYTIEALAEAATPFQEQRLPGQQQQQQEKQQQRQHEGSVSLAQEALKAWTTLLAAWRSETEEETERQNLLTWLHEDKDGEHSSSLSSPFSSSSSSSLFASLLNSTVCFLGATSVPSEIKGQAALGLILAILQACPADEAAHTLNAQARALQSCFLPTSLPSSSSTTSEHFPSFPALNGVAPLLASLAQIYPEGRLSLAKALLIATPISILTTPLILSSSSSTTTTITTLLGGPALDLLLTECQSPFPPARLLAFMSLETWLLRAAEHVHAVTATATAASADSAATAAPAAPATAATLAEVIDALSLKSALPTAANFLFWNWETTNRRVATVVPSAFERLVQLLQALEKLETAEQGKVRTENVHPPSLPPSLPSPPSVTDPSLLPFLLLSLSSSPSSCHQASSPPLNSPPC